MSRVTAAVCGRRTKWLVVALWVAILAVAVPLASKLSEAQENDASAYLPGDAESTRVLELAQNFRDSDVVPAVVVYARGSGITPADRTAAGADARAFAAVPDVTGRVSGPMPSPDGQALRTVVRIDPGNGGWLALADTVDRLRQIADSGAAGLTVHVTGPAGFAADSAEAFSGIDGRLLFAALGVVILLLLLTYRSPVLWVLPILSAVAALGASQAVVYLLATRAGLTVNGQSAGILTVLVIGAGTDYALLLVARYREELRKHTDRHAAMAVALRRAGPAIVASAATVTVGMLCLLVAELNSTSGLGPVAAVGIVVALAAMVTLLPALLVITGRWVFWPVRPRYGSAEPTASGVWARAGRFIAGRPRTVWVATALVLGIMAIGLVRLNPGVIPNEDTFTSTPESVVGQQVLSAHFPGGTGQPVQVISDAGAADRVRATVAGTRGITSVTQPRTSGGQAYLEATLRAEPDSDAARATVQRLRDSLAELPRADALVGGSTAIALDVNQAAQRDSRVIIPLTLAAVFVILALLLRALVAPLLLIATVVLSFAAALGVSAVVFQYLFGFDTVATSFPLFVFIFLVALGIDYNIFLMTRVREEAARLDPRRGALAGLAATGAVITSAGLVLAGTFAVLATLPIVAFAQIGFAVAFGVLLDTIVVRSVLVTALNLDLGRWMWWPSRLSAPRRAVHGRVSGPDGAPVGAVLTLADPRGRQLDRTRTGDAGRYALRCPDGDRHLLVCAPDDGYAPHARWVAADDREVDLVLPAPLTIDSAP